MYRILILMLYILFSLNSQLNALTLKEAILKLKNNNLEIKTAKMDEQISEHKSTVSSSASWGKIDFIQDVVRSNDAGNVFGFKLSSREASLSDFGFSSDILTDISNITSLTDTSFLEQPIDGLNYPAASGFFQSKLRYQVPLYAGGKIVTQNSISSSMEKLKKLDTQALINEKIFEIKKSYYDMALLDSSLRHLRVVINNIENLEVMTQSMIEEGYAKNIDLLEVSSKKSKVARHIHKLSTNRTVLLQYISFLLNTEVLSIEVPKEALSMPIYESEDILQDSVKMNQVNTAIEIKSHLVRMNKAAYLPEVGAYAEVGTASTTFLEDASEHSSYTFGARLSWNFYNGGADGANLQISKIELLKISTQKELIKRGVELKVSKIKTEIENLDYDIDSLSLELNLAESIYSSYEERYKEHLSSMNDVLIKHSIVIEKILELQHVKNQRNQKIFDYEKIANQGEL